MDEPWQHLKAYGYAPGHYMNKCQSCCKVCDDLDKRATCCRPCAEQRHLAKRTIASLTQPETDMDKITIERETLLPCPFCGCAMSFRSNRDTHNLTGPHGEDCVFDADVPALSVPATDDQMHAVLVDWNRRAALAAQPAPAAVPPKADSSSAPKHYSHENNRFIWSDGWNACRSAMIAAAGKATP
jgi:hypothetical protein